MTKAFITGIAGPALNADERAFIQAERPWGFILFKRNIENPGQVALLADELKQYAGHSDAPILIDQEGGRVQRLGPPHWPAYPSGALFGKLYDIDQNLGLSATSGSSASPSTVCHWRMCQWPVPMPSSATVPMEPNLERWPRLRVP
jgi:beta-N-acetylhexosaminidase